MSRPARIQAIGVPLHITQRGHWRKPVFNDWSDFGLYLESMANAALKNPVSLHAFCLMTNHVHLLISPYSGLAVSRFVQQVNARFGILMNKRWQRNGAIWDGRYRSRAVTNDNDFLACMRYIDNNPVKAGMAMQPGDYAWGSFNHYRGVKPLPWIKAHATYQALGNSDGERFRAYLGMFEEDGKPPASDP